MFFRKSNGKSSFTRLLPILLLSPNWKKKTKELEKQNKALFGALKGSSYSRPSPRAEGKGKYYGEEAARSYSKWGPSVFFGWFFKRFFQILFFILLIVGLLYGAGYVYIKYKSGSLTEAGVSVSNALGPNLNVFQKFWKVITFDETAINEDFSFKDPTKKENIVKKGVKIIANSNKQDYILGDPIDSIYNLKADETENPYTVKVTCKIQDSKGWHEGKTLFEGVNPDEEGSALVEVPQGSEVFENSFSCSFPAEVSSALELNTEGLATLKIKVEAFYDYSTTSCTALYSTTEETYQTVKNDAFYTKKFAEASNPRCTNGCGLTLLSLDIKNPWIVPSATESIYSGRYAVKGLLKQDDNWEGSILAVKDAKLSLPSTAVIERGSCDGIMNPSLLPNINLELQKSYEASSLPKPLGFICNFVIRKTNEENVQYGDLCAKVQYTYTNSILDTIKIRKQSLFAQSDSELYAKMKNNLNTMIENKQGLFKES